LRLNYIHKAIKELFSRWNTVKVVTNDSRQNSGHNQLISYLNSFCSVCYNESIQVTITAFSGLVNLDSCIVKKC